MVDGRAEAIEMIRANRPAPNKTAEVELVHLGGEWVIAKRVPVTAYGAQASKDHPGGEVWADPKTTGWLGLVGDERATVPMPLDPE